MLAQDEMSFHGTGSEVSAAFVLEEGITIFHMSHDGGKNFIIWLYEAGTGEQVALLVNEIGSFSGSMIVGVTGKIGQASRFQDH